MAEQHDAPRPGDQLAEQVEDDFLDAWRLQFVGLADAAAMFCGLTQGGHDVGRAVARLESAALDLAALEDSWRPLLRSTVEAALQGAGDAPLALRAAALDMARQDDSASAGGTTQDRSRAERMAALTGAAERFVEGVMHRAGRADLP